jgi:hypothetical protein
MSIAVGVHLAKQVGLVVLYLAMAGDIELNPGPETFKDIKCILLNARSLKSFQQTTTNTGNDKVCKLVAFKNLVYGGDYDIIAVTETWLNSSIKDDEILRYGYKIYRHNRIGRVGGGVLLAVKDSIVLKRR